jgi:hypothetical protein
VSRLPVGQRRRRKPRPVRRSPSSRRRLDAGPPSFATAAEPRAAASRRVAGWKLPDRTIPRRAYATFHRAACSIGRRSPRRSVFRTAGILPASTRPPAHARAKSPSGNFLRRHALPGAGQARGRLEACPTDELIVGCTQRSIAQRVPSLSALHRAAFSIGRRSPRRSVFRTAGILPASTRPPAHARAKSPSGNFLRRHALPGAGQARGRLEACPTDELIGILRKIARALARRPTGRRPPPGAAPANGPSPTRPRTGGPLFLTYFSNRDGAPRANGGAVRRRGKQRGRINPRLWKRIPGSGIAPWTTSEYRPVADRQRQRLARRSRRATGRFSRRSAGRRPEHAARRCSVPALA